MWGENDETLVSSLLMWKRLRSRLMTLQKILLKLTLIECELDDNNIDEW